MNGQVRSRLQGSLTTYPYQAPGFASSFFPQKASCPDVTGAHKSPFSGISDNELVTMSRYGQTSYTEQSGTISDDGSCTATTLNHADTVGSQSCLRKRRHSELSDSEAQGTRTFHFDTEMMGGPDAPSSPLSDPGAAPEIGLRECPQDYSWDEPSLQEQQLALQEEQEQYNRYLRDRLQRLQNIASSSTAPPPELSDDEDTHAEYPYDSAGNARAEDDYGETVEEYPEGWSCSVSIHSGASACDLSELVRLEEPKKQYQGKGKGRVEE